VCPVGRSARICAGQRHFPIPDGSSDQSFDIFEVTEQIQQLVIARAITGLRVE
jgi:hypothetical protein